MQPMTNRRSPRVPNEPWRGPANLTIAQTVALLTAGIAAGGVWWLGTFVFGTTLLAVFGHIILTSIAGGGLALVFYAMADPNREPTIRQHLLFSFRRHTYIRKEPRHDIQPIPFHTPHASYGARHAAAAAAARLGQGRPSRPAFAAIRRRLSTLSRRRP